MATVQDIIDFVADQMQNNNSGYKIKVRGFVRTVWNEIKYLNDWSWNYREGYLFSTIARYKTGTVAMANGSTSVTGTGTTFTTSMVGRKFRITGDTSDYIIAQVASATSLIIDRIYTGTTGTGLSFDIYQSCYFISGDFDSIYYLYQEYSPLKLTEFSEKDFYSTYPSPMLIGTPQKYFVQHSVIGNFWIAPGKLSFKSTGSDSNKTVIVRGLSDNVETFETVTLKTDGGGIVSTSKSYNYIGKISKETTENLITVTLPGIDGLASGLTFNLGPEVSESKFTKVALHPFPENTLDIFGSYKRNPYVLSQPTDTVPDILETAIKLGALSLALAEDENFAESRVKKLEKEQAIARAIGNPAKSSDARPRFTINWNSMYDRRQY